MKIAIVAPIEESVPPKKYGGTEWIVYNVADGISKKGHQVDLYAAGDSNNQSQYKLVPIVDRSIRTLPTVGDDPKLRETTKLLTYSETVEILNTKDYDLIHNHASWRLLLFGHQIKTPILTTHHGPLSYRYQNIIFRKYKEYPYVSISNNQRRDFPDLNFLATVYNGINIGLFPYFENPDLNKHEYMAYLARLSDEKGALEAAKTAVLTSKPLHVAAKIDLVDRPYYERFKPLVDGEIVKFLEEFGPDQRVTHLQNARLLLVPIKWEEPFGLMFIEAMACGTPVVTFARGSAPEIIVDGQTGFLVNQSDEFKRGDWIVKKTGVEGLSEAVEKIYSLSDEEYRTMRRAARKRVEDHFTVERMVDGYEAVYQHIANKR